MHQRRLQYCAEPECSTWGLNRAVCLQVTAYQVIQNSGATGKMPTQVQFKISDPGDQAVGAHTDPCLTDWGPHTPANAAGLEIVQVSICDIPSS